MAHRAYGVTQWFTGNFVEARAHLEQAAGDFRSGARSRSRLPLRPGRRRFRDGLSGDRALAARRGRSRARDRRRDGGANREIEPSRDLDIWPDALRHVRDHRPERRSRRPSGQGAVQRRARAWDRLVDRFRGLPGSLGGIAIRRPGYRSLESCGGPPPCFNGMASGRFSRSSGRLWRKRKREMARRRPLWPRSIKRLRTSIAQDSAGSTRRSTACAAKSFSSKIPQTPASPKTRSSPPSPSRRLRRPAASNCARRSALAKLYRSTGRPADAHAVLGPALEGFAPTPEMPEITEAQALLGTLA